MDLQWACHDIKPLGNEEVEVEIHATGFDFRVSPDKGKLA